MIIDDFGISDEEQENEPVVTRNSRNSIITLALYSGWLKKQSNSSPKNWGFRYFALMKSKLYYYKQPCDRIPCGVLNFDQVSFDLQAHPKHKPEILSLVPINSPYAIRLKCKNSSDLQEWAGILSQAILTSKGKINSLTSRASNPKFWKSERTCPKELSETVDTGDLLLFREKDPKQSSRAKYVHVAFVIKYPNGEIGIMDANSSDGVNIVMFEEFTASYKPRANSDVIYRQLITERNDETFLKIDEFVKKLDRKKFSLPPIKLLQRSNVDNTDEETAAFCSELVASAFKALGYLSSDVPASQYFPDDFGPEKRLNLIGAKFSPEVLIDFENE